MNKRLTDIRFQKKISSVQPPHLTTKPLPFKA